MNETTVKLLALGATYLGLLIVVIRIGINAVKGRTEQNLKITQMEKDLVEIDTGFTLEMKAMDRRHALDILRIETSIEGIRKDNIKQFDANIEQHGLLFKKLEEVGRDTATIKGYLSAKKEK